MRLIKNPVRKGPWSPDMPNNFCGSYVSPKKLAETADLNLKVIRRRPYQPRRPSAKQLKTQTFFEQLVPLYPFLSKTQVRAAIILANNNLHQSRLFLDLANKFMKIPPLNLVLNFQPPTSSDLPKDDTVAEQPNNFTTVLRQVTPSPCLEQCEDVQLNQGTESSFSTSDNSQSSVYDFDDSEYHSEPIQSWASQKMQMAKKKVGVSIIKSSKGYRAFLL